MNATVRKKLRDGGTEDTKGDAGIKVRMVVKSDTRA